MASTLRPSTTGVASDAEYGPWNPGIVSPVPRHLRHLETLFRPENVVTSVRDAEELADLTGMALPDVVAFRPQRLALHELLIRITAEISVPDGTKIEDLGINFREITRRVLGYVQPQLPAIVSAYERLRSELKSCVEAEMSALLDESEPAPPIASSVPRRGWLSLLRRAPRNAAVATRATVATPDPIAALEARAREAADPATRAAALALVKVIASVLARRGALRGYRELIVALATDLASNALGSEAIGREIDSLLALAADREGYRRLPPQDKPVVMNTKGPSAAGKSTLRPLQRALAGRIGVDWGEFALISPDIWRKQLLDYGSLGADYKYGGAFSGDELSIIDQKLDRYMARKAERGGMSHLLIDRFRFDSFAPDSEEAGSNLLTRFGQIVYMFFLVTPPASLVERAWTRGLEVGRYKSVDDVLAHSVEAYSGMPQLFFTWVERRDKRVHFEFLDNSVRFGELPRTIAFGWNDTLNVLDVAGMLDIERFRRVNVDATAPAALYPDPAVLAPENNTGFLRQSVERFRTVNFANRNTGRVYLRMTAGRLAWVDRDALLPLCADPSLRAGIHAIAAAALGGEALAGPDGAVHLDLVERAHTVGAWGAA